MVVWERVGGVGGAQRFVALRIANERRALIHHSTSLFNFSHL